MSPAPGSRFAPRTCLSGSPPRRSRSSSCSVSSTSMSRCGGIKPTKRPSPSTTARALSPRRAVSHAAISWSVPGATEGGVHKIRHGGPGRGGEEVFHLEDAGQPPVLQNRDVRHGLVPAPVESAPDLPRRGRRRRDRHPLGNVLRSHLEFEGGLGGGPVSDHRDSLRPRSTPATPRVAPTSSIVSPRALTGDAGDRARRRRSLRAASGGRPRQGVGS